MASADPAYAWDESQQLQHQQDQQQHRPYTTDSSVGSASTLNRSASTYERSGIAPKNWNSGDRHSLAAFQFPNSGYPHAVSGDTADVVPSIPAHLKRVHTLVTPAGGNSSTSIDSTASTVAEVDDPRRSSQRRADSIYLDSRSTRSSKRLSARASAATSLDHAQMPPPDTWSQRWMHRYSTEQEFREQRQTDSTASTSSRSSATPASALSPPPPAMQHPDLSPYTEAQPFLRQPPDMRLSSGSNKSSDLIPPQLRSPSLQTPQPRTSSLSYTPNLNPSLLGPNPAHAALSGTSDCVGTPKAPRSSVLNRQSMHNILQLGDPASQQHPVAMASTVTQQGQPGKPAAGQAPPPAEATRSTPPALPNPEDFSQEDLVQLVKDHRELREKYTKVKKYYFEKEDQVKQLQNSLAHQRLSQSRTSLDDSEYATRFSRLDGLIAQLAFSIRKSWKSMPTFLAGSINKDAVVTGKQEMTAAGRAIISSWLVEEVFEKYFHPDLEPSLSLQLKSVQSNIRRFGPTAQSAEDADSISSKIVNWRLATIEGLQDALRSPQCGPNRQTLMDHLRVQLIESLAVHLHDPPPSDLEGGVHMIIELVVGIAAHLPLESREVVVEYFWPGLTIVPDQMKVESGIPQLTSPIADDAVERASLKSGTSDPTTDSIPDATAHAVDPPKKRSMLSALTGSGGGDRKSKSTLFNKQALSSTTTASSGSQSRPSSPNTAATAAAAVASQEAPPRVRLAAGVGVQVHGRAVLVKAPVYST